MTNNPYMAQFLGEGRTYRCIAGSWEHRQLKFDWNDKDWGFCVSDEQCMVSKEGEIGEDITPESFYAGTTPACIENEQFIFDHYCEAGSWTSRTKFLASEMKEIADGNDYTLYCTHYEDALVSVTSPQLLVLGGDPADSTAPADLSIESDTGTNYLYVQGVDSALVPPRENTRINNLCLIKFDDKVAFGTTLNHPLNDKNSILTAIFPQGIPSDRIVNGDVCDDDDGFRKCDLAEFGLTGELWYSSSLNAVIYGKDGLRVEGILNTIVRFFRDFFRDAELVDQRTFIEEAREYNQLYIMEKGSKKVKAVLERTLGKETLIAEYEGFTTPLCDYANTKMIDRDEFSVQPLSSDITASLACTKRGSVQRVEAVGSGEELEFIWKQLTGKLRVE